jgi:anti-sigma-K factor RskA
MSTPRSHDEFKDLVGPYALGAVPPEEAQELRAHIRGCEECTGELRSAQEVVDGLAFAIEPVPLPHGFSERVLARVAAESPATVIPAPSRQRFWWPALVGAAALLILAAVVGAGYLNARRDLDRSKRIVAALWRTDADFTLEGEGRAKMITTSDGGMVFVARGLASIDGSRDYQLWLMRGSCAEVASPACEKISAGTFEVRDGVAVVRSPDSLKGFNRAAVTVEKKGGAKQPTTTPVLLSA